MATAAFRQVNPSPAMTLLMIGGVALGGWALWSYFTPPPVKKGKKKSKPKTGTVELSGVYAPSATLGNAPEVLADVEYPIKFLVFFDQSGEEPSLIKFRDPETGDIYIPEPNGEVTDTAGEVIVTGPDELGLLVTNMTSEATLLAYTTAIEIITVERLLELPTANDIIGLMWEAEGKILLSFAPNDFWMAKIFKAKSQEEVDPAALSVWTGVMNIIDLAVQTQGQRAGLDAGMLADAAAGV